MEIESPMLDSRQANTPKPDSIRQRQRNRLSPRRRWSREHRIATTVREVYDKPNAAINLSPPPRAKGVKKNSLDMSTMRRKDDLRQENNAGSRARGMSNCELNVDITPDGGSAGREGRQFTVANVGNNGRIYLRPTVRPANQRYPQPPFVFPITPPGTAGLENLVSRDEENESQRGSLWASLRSPPTTPIRPVADRGSHLSKSEMQPRTRRRRAHSYSTLDGQHISVKGNDIGAFKVVIERPRPDGRPKTTEHIDPVPTLQVSIPSYKLGIPGFSTRGTAFFRGSSYAATDDMRSSVISQDVSKNDRATLHPGRILSRRHSHSSPQPCMVPASPIDVTPLPSPAVIPPRITIEPAMFDDLTFKPACDHRSIVRYSSATGAITAATPPRLVAEITSPSFLDYDLLSDFFLTFRTFLSTSDLLAMVVARLRWALDRDDETGMVVRVRTFVALRHWILNYFMDDFVLDYDLRKTFCELVNAFVNEVIQNPGKRNRLKILGELKKCYRRVCSIYWDGPEFSADLGPEIPISIGGVAGSRLSCLTPSFWLEPQEEARPPQLDGILSHDASAELGYNFFADVSRAGYMNSIFVDPRASLQTVEAQDPQRDPPLSPRSILSDVVSCSFPTRSKTTQLGANYPLGAHPVPSSSRYDSSPPIAYTPRVFTGKRSRQTHAHKRSGSFSDSLRDKRKPICTVVHKDTEVHMALPNYGSLVRGGVFPPGQALVQALAPSTPLAVDRGTTYFAHVSALQKGASAMSGTGMKKLIGSVRRALSTRAGGVIAASPTSSSFPQITPLELRYVTDNQLPGTAVVPHAPQHEKEGRAPVRIDILGAGIAEDFKKAVREDAEADAHKQERSASLGIGVALGNEAMYPPMHPDVTEELEKPYVLRTAMSALTNGSKSIVIVDDTLPFDQSIIAGALPMNTSIEAFADTCLQPSGGPTPPSTPPGQFLGSRQSSQMFCRNTYNHNRALSLEQTPSLVHDICSPSEVEQSPSYRPQGHLSMRSFGRPYNSNKSMSLRRYASYQSGFTRQATERSFDATTFSGSGDRLSELPVEPAPLRVLRRRPGGDLRAVSNVGELPQRPSSAGSLTTYSDSVRSSYLLGRDSIRDSNGYVEVVNGDDFSRSNVVTFSLGALAEAPKRNVSLFSTHSSQPVMRPSFEAEAAKLAQIPDDDDDGGVESALLKLEGKFERRRSDMSASVIQGAPASPPQSRDNTDLGVDLETPEDDEKRRHRHKHIVENIVAKTPPLLDSYRPDPPRSLALGKEALKPTVYQPRQAEAISQPLQPGALVESYLSTPLRQRPDTFLEVTRRESRNWNETSILRGASNERNQLRGHTPGSSDPSFDFIDDSESLKRIPAGGSFPGHASREQSFLESESDDESDLSSEISIEVISRTEYTGEGSASTFPPTRSGTVIKEIALPSHPLRLPSSYPSSPSMTIGQALSLSPDTAQAPQVHAHQLQQWSNPGVTPSVSINVEEDGKRSWEQNGQAGHLEVSSKASNSSRANSIHLPFILAFDSKVLAQQFTLIEKDALNEIDWKELIDMRWKNASTAPRSWVHFLRTQKPRGVEVVIARFNIMVKWAVSECVLTQNLEERVQTIIKYIHIAAHCRRYRNYATMYQLTVALTSNEITRLTKTWQYIPATDVKILKDLEALVQPTRNFHNLRAEMEGAGGDQGCIPFVGIYTHDLLFNSQRPSQIASTPTTEPLVNFERCRTTATIIKNLLRLLEASNLYRFQPIEGITERCLWMAALSDEEIRHCGSTIE